MTNSAYPPSLLPQANHRALTKKKKKEKKPQQEKWKISKGGDK